MEQGKEKQNWSQHIEKWRRSGMTQRDYCRENELSYWSFRAHLKKNPTGTPFVEIKNTENECVQVNSIEVIIDNHVRLQLPLKYSREQFRNILIDMGIQSCR